MKDSSDFAFMDTGLSKEEEEYIAEQLEVIGEKITDLPAIFNTDELVSLYYGI